MAPGGRGGCSWDGCRSGRKGRAYEPVDGLTGHDWSDGKGGLPGYAVDKFDESPGSEITQSRSRACLWLIRREPTTPRQTTPPEILYPAALNVSLHLTVQTAGLFLSSPFRRHKHSDLSPTRYFSTTTINPGAVIAPLGCGIARSNFQQRTIIYHGRLAFPHTSWTVQA